MASGFFAGGMAEGMNSAAELGIKRDTLAQDLALKTRGLDLQQSQQAQTLGLQTRALDLQAQAQKNAEHRDLMSRADKSVADTMALVAESTQHMIDAGQPPAKIAEAVQPLIQSAKSIAAKAGSNPASLDAQLAVMLARPPTPPKFGAISEDATGGKKMGFIDAARQTVTAPTNAGAPAAEPTLPGDRPTGDTFLKTLSPDDQSLVKQVAEYSVQPKDLSIKGGHREKILALAQQYDPTYDSLLAPARAAAIKEFNSGGNNSPSGKILAGNTAMKHLGEVSDAAEAVKAMPGVLQGVANAGIPFLSYAAAVAQNKAVAGTPEGVALTNFATAVNHFSEEVTKFYSGSSGSEAERNRALANLNAAKSLPELRAAIAQEANLMKSNVDSLQARWHQALGPKAFERKLGEGDFPLIQKSAADALMKIQARSEGKPVGPAGASDSAIPPPPDGFIRTR